MLVIPGVNFTNIFPFVNDALTKQVRLFFPQQAFKARFCICWTYPWGAPFSTLLKIRHLRQLKIVIRQLKILII